MSDCEISQNENGTDPLEVANSYLQSLQDGKSAEQTYQALVGNFSDEEFWDSVCALLHQLLTEDQVPAVPSHEVERFLVARFPSLPLQILCRMRDELTHDELIAHVGQDDEPTELALGQPTVNPFLADTTSHHSMRLHSTGTMIDNRYEVLETFAGGGMGVVYKVNDTRLQRVVALKQFRCEVKGNEQRFSRFTQEPNIVSQLKNSNIVEIYEQSNSANYFTMEYCAGGSLDRYIKGTPIDQSIAAKITMQIAFALYEAHQNRVIHRDIKPANILLDCAIAPHQTCPTPKLTDFGLAKNQDRSGPTGTGDLIGTIEYISPEVVRNKNGSKSAQPTADIYSLGVVLYECLTGRSPFRGADEASTLNLILNHDPVPVHQENPSVDQRLEIICMKCLERHPERRYKNAKELGEDLRRFLDGEPIHARPPGVTTKVRKWSGKHPVISTVTAVGAVSVMIVLGLLVRLTFVNTKLKIALEQELETQQKADQLIGFLSGEGQSNEIAGTHPLRRKMLEKAREYYEWFVINRSKSPGDQYKLALAHLALADINSEIGPTEQSGPEYREAILLLEKLKSDDPKNLLFWEAHAIAENQYGLFQSKIGKYLEAIGSLKESAETLQSLLQTKQDVTRIANRLANALNNLAKLHHRQGDLETAAIYFQQANDVYTQYLEPTPDVPAVCNGLAALNLNHGNFLKEQGNLEESGKSYQRSADLWKELSDKFPNEPDYQYSLAKSLFNLGQFHNAIDIMEPLCASNPAVSGYSHLLATSYLGEGNSNLRSGDSKLAKDYAAKSQAILTKIADMHLDHVEFQLSLINSYDTLIQLNGSTGELVAGAKAAQKALVIWDRLAPQVRDCPKPLETLAGLYHSLAMNYWKQNNNDAITQEELAGELIEKLHERSPQNIELKLKLAQHYNQLGLFQSSNNKIEMAVESFQKADTIWKQGPTHVTWIVGRAGSYVNLGGLEFGRGNIGAAVDCFNQAKKLLVSVVSGPRPPHEAFDFLHRLHCTCAIWFAKTGRNEECTIAVRDAVALEQHPNLRKNAVLAFIIHRGNTYCGIAKHFKDTGNYDSAISWSDNAIVTLKPVVGANPANELARQYLRTSHWIKAESLGILGRHSEALKDWQDTVELADEHLRPQFRTFAALNRVRAGEHIQAMREAEQLSTLAALPLGSYFDLARIMSVCSSIVLADESTRDEDRSHLAAQYAARAVQILDKARSAGLFDNSTYFDRLIGEPDLDSLRQREDFQHLVQLARGA